MSVESAEEVEFWRCPRETQFAPGPQLLPLTLPQSCALCARGCSQRFSLGGKCVRGETQTQDQRTAEPGGPLSLWPSSPPACCRAGQGGENVCCGASLRPRVLTGVYRKLSVVRPWVWLMRSSWMTGQCVTAYVVLNVTAGSPELGGRLPFVVHVVVLRLFCGVRGRCEVNVEHSVADVGSGWAGCS